MRKLLFLVVFAASVSRAAAPVKSPAAPETLTVRSVAWDAAWKPASEKEWLSRVVAEVASAAGDGADVIVFPESFSGGRTLEGALDAVRAAAGADRLVILGNAPHTEPGWDYAVRRAYILVGGSWQNMDKLDPTPAERALKLPVKAGMRLPLFRFRGGVVAALPAYSLLKPEISASLKKRAVQLVLVSASAEDAEGAARLSRAGAARAVELGAAIVIAPPAPDAPAVFLPAQKGFDLKPQAPAGRDVRLPWRKLLDLRAKPDGSEPRPFLDPAPYYQIEI